MIPHLLCHNIYRNECKSACLNICFFFPGVKGEYLVLNTPIHITQNPKFYHFCQISGISGTFGSLTPMGEHPWVTEV